MNIKNKIGVVALCALATGIGVFGITGTNVQAETATISATATVSPALSIDQLQQIVNNLILEIQKVAQMIARLKPLETCGNHICRFGETAANCPKDCITALKCLGEGESGSGMPPAGDYGYAQVGCCSGLKELQSGERF
jgi:hypothetical protein